MEEEQTDQQRKLWHSLGLDMEAVEVMASTLQLRFQNGRLWLRESAAGMPDLVDTVVASLLSTW
eukprot:9569280-Lingulodinium_polyedra.AAC.1